MITRISIDLLSKDPAQVFNITRPQLAELTYSELQAVAQIAIQQNALKVLDQILKLVKIGKLSDGTTLYHCAIDNNSSDAIAILIKTKIEQLPDEKGNYPAHYAVETGKNHLLFDLLNGQVTTGLCNQKGEEVLDLLFYKKDFIFAIWLIEERKCALTKSNLSNLYSALEEILHHNDYETLALFLKGKSKLKFIAMEFVVNKIPAMPDFSKSELLNHLVYSDNKTKALLVRSVIRRHRLDILAYLESQKFSMSLDDELHHALLLAASVDAYQIVDWLLLINKSLIEITLKDGRNVAHVAAQHGSVKTLKILADKYPSILLKLDASGSSAKVYSAQSGSTEAMEVLNKQNTSLFKKIKEDLEDNSTVQDFKIKEQQAIIISAMQHGKINILKWAQKNNLNFRMNKEAFLDSFRIMIRDNHQVVIAWLLKAFDWSRFNIMEIIRKSFIFNAMSYDAKDVLEFFFEGPLFRDPVTNSLNITMLQEFMVDFNNYLSEKVTSGVDTIPPQALLKTLNFILGNDHYFKNPNLASKLQDYLSLHPFTQNQKNDFTKMMKKIIENNISKNDTSNFEQNLNLFFIGNFQDAFAFVLGIDLKVLDTFQAPILSTLLSALTPQFPVYHQNHQIFIDNLKKYLEFVIEIKFENLFHLIFTHVRNESEKNLASHLIETKLEQLYRELYDLKQHSPKMSSSDYPSFVSKTDQLNEMITSLFKTFTSITGAPDAFHKRNQILCRLNQQQEAARLCLESIEANDVFSMRARIELAELLLNGLEINEDGTPLKHLFNVSEVSGPIDEDSDLYISSDTESIAEQSLHFNPEVYAAFGRAIQAFYLLKDIVSSEASKVKKRCHEILSGNFTAEADSTEIYTWLPEAKELFLKYAHYKQNFNDSTIMRIMSSCAAVLPKDLKVPQKEFWSAFVKNPEAFGDIRQGKKSEKHLKEEKKETNEVGRKFNLQPNFFSSYQNNSDEDKGARANNDLSR